MSETNEALIARTELALHAAIKAVGPMPSPAETPEQSQDRSASLWAAMRAIRTYAMEFDRVGFSVQCPGLVKIEATTDHQYDDQGTYFADVQSITVTRRVPGSDKLVSISLPTCADDPLTEQNEFAELYEFAGMRKPEDTAESIAAMSEDDDAIQRVEEAVQLLVSAEPIRDYIYAIAQDEGVGGHSLEF